MSFEIHKEHTDVLFFSAHPDDAEFAAGGTLIKLARKYKVANVILTRGEAGTHGTPEIREREAECAGKTGGYTIEFLDFRDNFVDDTAENAHKLAQVIRKYKPKIIFAPYHTNNSTHLDGVSHPDHLNTGRLVLKAARFAKFKNALLEGEAHAAHKIIYYMIPKDSKPDILIDVSDVVLELQALWECHASQFKNLGGGKLPERLLQSRQFFAQNSPKTEYAEGFIIDEPIFLCADYLID